MATVSGARSIGRNDLGRLEVGAKADIITIELDTPTPINEHNLYDQLILFRNPQNVSNVLVNGKILKKDGILLNIDVEKIKNDLRVVTQKLWDKQ
jgi:cytosine/adenosine deaminase-related metal-dependent hydrolase